MQWIRRQILNLLHPLLWTLGRTRRKSTKLTSSQFYELSKILEPGDVLVTRTSGNVLNWFIPGFWSHAVLFVDCDEQSCVDAVFPKVRRVNLMDLMLHVDHMAIMRPKFATEEQKLAAMVVAESFIGRPYDLVFEPAHDAFYCSELVWQVYAETVEDWDFEARERLGVETVTPQDLYDASKHFDCIWEN